MSRSARGVARGPIVAGCLAAGLLAYVALPPVARGDERSDVETKLERAIASKDAENARALLLAATRPGDERAVKLLVALATRLKPLQAHQALVDSMKQVKDEAAVKELIEQALKGTYAEMRALFVEGLAAQGSPAAVAAVLDALDDKDELVASCAARCARGFPAPETVDRLIAHLEKAEPKPQEATLARELLGALSAVTGESLSFALEWKGWWMEHSATWKPPAAPAAPAADKPAADKPAEGTGTVLDRLRHDRPEDARAIERLKEDVVIVVRGEGDRISEVLRAAKVPHKEIGSEDVSKIKLSPSSVLVLNCNNRKNQFSGVELAEISEFVSQGGYLFASNTQLELLIPKAFPGSVALDKRYIPPRRTEPLKIAIVPSAPRHPLLRDVFPATAWDGLAFAWTMEAQAAFPRILTPEVNVLITSPDCKKLLDNDVVAFAFRWHKGKVVPFGAHGRRPAGRPRSRAGASSTRSGSSRTRARTRATTSRSSSSSSTSSSRSSAPTSRGCRTPSALPDPRSRFSRTEPPGVTYS